MFSARVGQKLEVWARLFFAGSAQELQFLTPGLWISCCSYLWIVPISSIRSGKLQDHYWLQGNAASNPALP